MTTEVGSYAAGLAYETAGVGPQDLSLVELHDASAPSEIVAYEYLGLCAWVENCRSMYPGVFCVKDIRSAPLEPHRLLNWRNNCRAGARLDRLKMPVSAWLTTGAA